MRSGSEPSHRIDLRGMLGAGAQCMSLRLLAVYPRAITEQRSRALSVANRRQDNSRSAAYNRVSTASSTGMTESVRNRRASDHVHDPYPKNSAQAHPGFASLAVLNRRDHRRPFETAGKHSGEPSTASSHARHRDRDSVSDIIFVRPIIGTSGSVATEEADCMVGEPVKDNLGDSTFSGHRVSLRC